MPEDSRKFKNTKQTVAIGSFFRWNSSKNSRQILRYLEKVILRQGELQTSYSLKKKKVKREKSI